MAALGGVIKNQRRPKLSHRIEYFHLAVRFPEAALRVALPGENIFTDHYLCLALGGDNNMTTSHPTTGREVCSRRWEAITAGNAGECIKDIARYSGWCEVGHMRLTGERHTKPESYIRSWRHAIEHALPFDRLLCYAGVSIQSKLSISRKRSEERANQVARLSALQPPFADAEAPLNWGLNLLAIREAAIFFQYHQIAPGEIWEKAKASGPCFGRSLEHIARLRVSQSRAAA